MGSPILPSKPSDPTGVDSLERAALRDFRRRFRRIRAELNAEIQRLPAQPVVNAATYTYALDTVYLASLLANVDSILSTQLLEGGQDNLWFFTGYVEIAATRGIAQQFANLSQQSPVYRASRQSVASIVNSPQHLYRMTLVKAREFEEMKGFVGSMKTDLSRVLADGIGRGQSPRVVAKAISDEVGLSEARANRIARSEITTALRRARLDESDDAQQALGLMTKELHISALSPTTRLSHAARHGKLFTTLQERTWWAEGANSINCKCTAVTVMVDASGNPVSPGIVNRAKAMEQRMRESGRGPWSESK